MKDSAIYLRAARLVDAHQTNGWMNGTNTPHIAIAIAVEYDRTCQPLRDDFEDIYEAPLGTPWDEGQGVLALLFMRQIALDEERAANKSRTTKRSRK